MVKTGRPTGKLERRKGAATVEFAVVAPVFLTLVLGTLEIGNALSVSSNLYTAVRGAGRLAAADFSDLLEPGQTGNAKVEQDLRNFLTASGIPGSEATITISHAEGPSEGQPFDLADEANYLETFRITVEIPHSAVASFPIQTMEGTTLKASLAFRKGKTQLVD